MSKYHINKKGEPVVCRATVRGCPVGGDHFDSLSAANDFVSNLQLIDGSSNVPDSLKKADDWDAYLAKISENIRMNSTNDSKNLTPDELAHNALIASQDVSPKNPKDINSNYMDNDSQRLTNKNQSSITKTLAELLDETEEILKDKTISPEDRKDILDRFDSLLERSNVDGFDSFESKNKEQKQELVLTYTVNGHKITVPEKDVKEARVLNGWNMSIHPSGPKIATACGHCHSPRVERFHNNLGKLNGRPIYICPSCGKYNIIPLVME